MIARILYIGGDKDGHIDEFIIGKNEEPNSLKDTNYILHDFVYQDGAAGQGKYDPNQPRLFFALPPNMRFLEACIKLVERYKK